MKWITMTVALTVGCLSTTSADAGVLDLFKNRSHCHGHGHGHGGLFSHHDDCCKPKCSQPKPRCCHPKPKCCKPKPKHCHPKPKCCKPKPRPKCCHPKPKPRCCKPVDSCCRSKRHGFLGRMLDGLDDMKCRTRSLWR